MPSLTDKRRRAGRTGIFGWLILFAVAVGFSIAFGLLFGVFHNITNSLNQTGIAVDSSFTNSVDTAAHFSSIGILIVMAIGVIGLAMLLIRVIGGMGR